MRHVIFMMLFFLTGTVMISCSFEDGYGRTEDMTVILPDWDGALPELSHWQVTVVASGLLLEFSVPAGEGGFVVKNLPANLPAAVTAEPVTYAVLAGVQKECRFFKPCGCLYPYAAGDGGQSLPLTWEGGFSARLMQNMFSAGRVAGYRSEDVALVAARVNWQKVESTVLKKQTDSAEGKFFYNPWLVDMGGVLAAIEDEELLTYKFNLNATTATAMQVEELVSGGALFSSYIPENAVIQSEGRVTVLKNGQTFFNYANYLQVVVNNGGKKSTEYVSLPIL